MLKTHTKGEILHVYTLYPKLGTPSFLLSKKNGLLKRVYIFYADLNQISNCPILSRWRKIHN